MPLDDDATSADTAADMAGEAAPEAVPGPADLNNPEATASTVNPDGSATDTSAAADSAEAGAADAGESDALAGSAQPADANDSVDPAAAPQEPDSAASDPSAGSTDPAPADPVIQGSQSAPDAMAQASETFAGPFEARWVDCGGADQVRLFQGANAEALADAFVDGIKQDGRTRDQHVADLSGSF